MPLHQTLFIGLLLFTPILQAEYRWQSIEPFALPYAPILTAQVDNSVWINDQPMPWHIAADGKLLTSFNPGDKQPVFTGKSVLFGKSKIIVQSREIWVTGAELYRDDGSLWTSLQYRRPFNSLPDTTYTVSLSPITARHTAEQQTWVLCSYVLQSIIAPSSAYPILTQDKRTILFLLDTRGSILTTLDLPVLPHSLSLLGDGSLWVNNQHIKPDGTPITTLDNFFNVAAQSDGTHWAISQDRQRLVHLDTHNNILEAIGGTGSDPGQFSYLEALDLAPDGSLWAVDSSNRRLNKFVLKSNPTLPAEYDELTRIVYLDDVTFQNQHFQVTLQEQQGLFKVLSINSANKTYANASSYDADTGVVNIAFVQAFGKHYRARLVRVDNTTFRLDSLSEI